MKQIPKRKGRHGSTATEREFRLHVSPDGVPLTQAQIIAKEFLAAMKK